MPEPVVIIGPAKGPAGPIGEPADAADRVAPENSGPRPQHEPKRGKGIKSMLLSALARLGSGLVTLLTRGLVIIAKMGMTVVNRYPRHSLAAGASLVILGAITYSQNFSSTGVRTPVTNEIKAPSSKDTPTDPKSAANTKTNGAAAKPVGVATKDSGAPEVAKPDDKLMAPVGASPMEDKPAPAPALVAKDDVDLPLPSLAEGTAAAQASEPAPEKAAPTADLTAAKTEPAPAPAPSIDQSTPTLLGSTPPPDPAPSPPLSVAKDDKAGGDAVKPAPAMEAPALIAALAPSSSSPLEVAPAPAPAGDPLLLATTGDDQGKSSSAPSASKPPPQSPVSETPPPAVPAADPANTNIKPNEALVPAEPKPVVKPEDAPKSDPVPQANPAVPQPASNPSESVKSTAPKPESAKAEASAPAPAVLGAAEIPKVTPASAATPVVPVPGRDVAGIAKPLVEGAAAGVVAAAAAAQHSASQPTMPALTPVTPTQPQVQIPDSRSQIVESKPQISETKEVKPGERDARPSAVEELTSAGWVSVPNSGKNLFADTTNDDAQRNDSSVGLGAESATTRDLRSHTAKDVSFEPESPRARGTAQLDQNGRQSVLGAGAGTEPRSKSAGGRVEPNAHVVEPQENFWTISRLYYSSGRYYRALWKANADRFPEIDKLKVNDVIAIPAVEDLDPAYIDPPRARAPASLGTARRTAGRSRTGVEENADGVADRSESSSTATRGEPISTARTNRGSDDPVPVRRSSRTDPDLGLPAADSVARRESAPDRTGRRVDRPLVDDDANSEFETRTAARPRAAAAYSKRRPVYKIRPNETLRSIARDMLGDSHRSSEILDLNRDLIDDPTHLIVGQVIELPEDARTSVRRSASR